MTRIFNVSGFCRWLTVRLSGRWGRCLGARCRKDGSLEMAFRAEGRTQRLSWGPAAVSGGNAQLRSFVSAGLEAIAARYDPAFFRWHNREVTRLVMDRTSLMRIFAPFLEIGKTRCGPHLLAAVRLDAVESALILTFESARESLRFAVVPARSIAAGRPGLIAANRALALYRVAEKAAPAGGPPAAEPLAEFLGFMLQRCSHDGMKVVASQDSVALGSTYFWDNDLSYQFFSEKEHDCISILNAMFAARGRIGLVANFDRECLNQVSILPFPVDTVRFSRWYSPPGPDFLEGFVNTDIGDVAAILGGGKRIAEVLDAGSGGRFKDFVFVWHSCLPQMIGETVQPESSAGRTACSRGCAQLACELTHGGNSYHHAQRFWELFFARAQERAGRGRVARPNSVNLLGYGPPAQADMLELERWAGKLGVEVSAKVVPSFAMDEASRFFGASYNIYSPDEATVKVLERAARRFAQPARFLSAPFGFSGTREWLLGLGELFGRRRRALRLWEQWSGEVRDRWQALRAEARSFRLGVVVGLENIPALVHPYFNYGIPLLPCLEEMGFGLDILVYDRFTCHDHEGRLAVIRRELEQHPQLPRYPFCAAPLQMDIRTLESALAHRSRHTIARFRDYGGMCRLLAQGPFSLVYSEIPRDSRVTSSGKIPFNIKMFKMGLGGAVETLERLLALCRVPFYREYKDYLEKA